MESVTSVLRTVLPVLKESVLKATATMDGKEEIKANVLKAVLMKCHTALTVSVACVNNVKLVTSGMIMPWTAYPIVFLDSTKMDTNALFAQIVVLFVIMRLETACSAMTRLLLGIIIQWLL